MKRRNLKAATFIAGSLLLAASAGGALEEDARWVLVSLHLHTMDNPGYHHNPFQPDPPVSYSVKGLLDILAQTRPARVQALVLTDHHSVGIGFDPEFAKIEDTALLLGMEWTSKDGHMNLIGYNPTGPRDILLPPDPSEELPTEPWAYRKTIETVQRRGGIAVINHPESPVRRWPENTFGADAVEIYNGSSSHLEFWERRLREGTRITAVGGSDYHSWDVFKDQLIAPQRNSPIRPLNLVHTGGEVTPGAILEATRRGRVLVLSGPQAPKLFLSVDRDGDGRYQDGHEGNTISLPRGRPATIRLRVEVRQGRGAELAVMDKGGTLKKIAVDADPFIHLSEHVLQPDPNGFIYSYLRAEVRRGEDYAVSNPVYFQSP